MGSEKKLKKPKLYKYSNKAMKRMLFGIVAVLVYMGSSETVDAVKIDLQIEDG